MHRFYAPPANFSAGKVFLGPDETAHLRDVLRLGVGSEVSVFDGDGHEFYVVVESLEKRRTLLAVLREVNPAAPESPFKLTLAPAVISGDKYDLVVQKAVELGVESLIPLHTIRCEIKLKDAARRLARWRRIALEATKQCGRARMMEIRDPANLDELFSAAGDERTVLFSERDGRALDSLTTADSMTAIVGPKGGWDDSELEAARSSGVEIVTLAGRTMRAETASIAIATILQHRFGDLN